MPLRTYEKKLKLKGTKKFREGMIDLMRKVSMKALLEDGRLLAWQLMSKCVAAPIPVDTGELMRSGDVFVDKSGRKVVFGFNKKYASIQDLGGRKLPAKPYGSPIGPNRYFTETLDRNASWLFAQLAERIRGRIGGRSTARPGSAKAGSAGPAGTTRGRRRRRRP